MDRAGQDRTLPLDNAHPAAPGGLARPQGRPLRQRLAPLLVGAAMAWIRVIAILILLAPLLLLAWVLASG